MYDSFNNYNKILIYTDREIEYIDQFDNIEIHNSHIFNFYNRFNRYAYVLPLGEDYSPRLLLEAHYMGKEILYFRNINKDDGGMTRKYDIDNGNIEKYSLNKEDKLIQYFI